MDRDASSFDYDTHTHSHTHTHTHIYLHLNLESAGTSVRAYNTMHQSEKANGTFNYSNIFNLDCRDCRGSFTTPSDIKQPRNQEACSIGGFVRLNGGTGTTQYVG